MPKSIPTLAYTDTDYHRQKLADQYYELSSLNQLIIQLFSVIYEPVGRSQFVVCLNQLGVRNQQGNLFTNQTIKPYIDQLLQVGLLIQDGGQGPQCHPLIVEIATRNAVQTQRFEALVQTVHACLPISSRWKGGPRYFVNERQLIREVRIGLYRRDIKYITQQFEDYRKYSHPAERTSLDTVLRSICNNPFDAVWLKTLPDELYDQILSSILYDSLLNLTPATAAFELLQSDCNQDQPCSLVKQSLLIEQLMLRGQLVDAQQQIEQLVQVEPSSAAMYQGWLFALLGKDEEAVIQYTIALAALKKAAGKRKVYLPSIGGLFFILVLLKQESASALSAVQEYIAIAQQSKFWLSPIYELLGQVIDVQQGDLSKRDAVITIGSQAGRHSIETLFRAICLYWVDVDQAKTRLPKILKLVQANAKVSGYTWIVLEASEVLARLGTRGAYRSEANALRQTSGMQSIVDLIQPKETWELCLTALTQVVREPVAVQTRSDKRLVWFLTLLGSSWLLQPREQAVTARGEWGKGRPIALKRLATKPGELDYLTPQDLQVCAHLKANYSGWETNYVFGERAIAALIGHPLVVWEDSPTTRVDLVKGEPELLVQKGKGDQLSLQFVPQIKDNNDILVVKESPTRLKVIEVTPEHRRIAEILGRQNRLTVPAIATDRVLAAINAVSRVVTVHSDIGGGVSAEEVPANPTPHVHLLPMGLGLKVAVLTRPFATGGPYYRPGTGGQTVIAEIEGKRLQTRRDLETEQTLANAAIAACPTLVRYDETDGEWGIEEPEDCLELLMELHNLADSIVLEWPEGEKLKVSRSMRLQDFQLSIKRQKDWFETTGSLKLDNDRVLDMQQLMQLLDQTSSRFIPLGDGQFLALTQEFRKRLDDLRAFSEKSGKGLRMHPLAALAVEDWVDEVGQLKADKHWKAHIQRLKEIQDFEPTLPSTLQAELRDYQMAGFQWLARLAHWGVGACLADDMGLGKTLQALALILTRAPDGPTLIVAPTSVGMNWMSEAQRFAPTLNAMQFGSGDRQKLLDSLQPFDMLVCSYGLLQQEEVAEMLAKVQWQTIVLDEAQSIKNFATKRSQAAMNLQGGFKLLTTGTPIENHLGELWNLFRFINPGLLGSLERFNQQYATPIERYGDKAARQRLKKLIQPFLLRRTKSQVLEELPSRTEILLHVELSQDELAFYEALRREAIAKLSDSDATAGAKHLQVLAEIMRLRRACCNTQLVNSTLALPSSKLQLFGEVLRELLENRHKALVFSQFVDHLHLIRDYLDAEKIQYQYLDGSTPAAERKKRVDAFQSGEGDVFLISLKAGGTGLNLTAADYVIHMDPWWNPAVEDQASDRAHRIGQQRPVTIYRLVAKNTIEEKIVDLHQHKRDLADSLLDGTDMSGKISTDELLRLIQEG